MGIAIGVGFAGDPDASTATLTFRRRRSMFDAAAGDRFADLYLACLDEVTAGADA